MSDLTSLRLVGPKTSKLLEQVGIHNHLDLLHFYPHRYLDFSKTLTISQCDFNSPATYSGQVISFQNIYTRSSKNIQKATIKDSTGSIDLIWFNSPYLQKTIKINELLCFAGTASLFNRKPTIIAPIIGHKTGRIVPIYHQTTGLSSNIIEKIVQQNITTLISKTFEILPRNTLTKHKLLDIKQALIQIHQPSNQQLLARAQTRIHLLQSMSLLATSHLQRQYQSAQKITKQFTKIPSTNFLPYKLSPSQQQAWSEVQHDLLQDTPAHRLLCGDVGSGKTIIALLAAHMAHANNQISLIIAPTQILAQQHFDFFKKTLPKHPIFFLASKPVKYPKNAILISTHTAFYQNNNFLKTIALLIIDEQHKFGVVQRNFLSKLANPPHSLSLTATPIPRTLALTAFGHLKISYLQHLPRWQKVKTYVVPPTKYEDCYQWLDLHIQKSHEQAFIVCPYIEESDKNSDVSSATTEYEKTQKLLPHLRIALIHSKIKLDQRQAIFDKYKNGEIDILITTPIIEVGIDFPNATVIIIQSAERFGLASLHQLRGRVGRGSQPGFCYLFTPKVNSRLSYLSTHFEGQQLAEFDLKNRGQGQLFSIEQHGHFPLDPESLSLASKIINDLETQKFDLNKLIVNSTESNLIN